jgi:hypothetical protein
MASKDGNSVPKSGKGSEASRLSDSPLSIRRGNADPTDINDTPLTRSGSANGTTTRTR